MPVKITCEGKEYWIKKATKTDGIYLNSEKPKDVLLPNALSVPKPDNLQWWYFIFLCILLWRNGDNFKLKTLKLKSDLLNKFSEYLKGTNPDEFYEIVEIQVKYNPKEDFNNKKLQEDKAIILKLIEMSDLGMEVEIDWKSKSLKELNKMIEDYKDEIADLS